MTMQNQFQYSVPPPACDGPVMYMRMIVMSVMIDIYQNVDKYWNEPQNYLNYSFFSM